MVTLLSLLGLVFAYLIGSISTSSVITHYSQQPDLRTQGLGTLSAENVLLLSGKEKALAVILLDGVKGFVAVLIAKMFGDYGFFLGLALLLALIGHMFPLYYKFRGGNGIATAVGGTLILSFWGGIVLIIVWFAVALATRYIHLATLLVAILLPILMLLFGHANYFIPTLLIALLVIIRNIEHAKRLRAGTETRASW